MKKILFIALFSILSMGAFAAKTSSAISNVEKKKVSLIESKAQAAVSQQEVAFFSVRYVESSCGTWEVQGADLGAELDWMLCEYACSQGWTWFVYYP